MFCSFSILYRISLFPFPSPSSVFLLFFFSKNLCRIVFCYSYVLRHHMPFSFSFSFSNNLSFVSFRFASSLDPLIAPRKETPARS